MAGLEHAPFQVAEDKSGWHLPAELGARGGHGGGDDGIQQDAEMDPSFGKMVENAVESSGLGGIFREGEGFGAVDIGIGVGDDLPSGCDAIVDGPCVHGF